MKSCHWSRVSGWIVSAILFTISWSAHLSAEQQPSVAGKAPFVSAPILPLSYSSSSMAVGDLNGDGKLAAVASTPKTYTSANFSGGARLYLGRHWIFYGNVLVALNNVGLRSDPVPLGGISFRK
jgi:hypothetical protein